jgi:hypothetical protein
LAKGENTLEPEMPPFNLQIKAHFDGCRAFRINAVGFLYTA